MIDPLTGLGLCLAFGVFVGAMTGLGIWWVKRTDPTVRRRTPEPAGKVVKLVCRPSEPDHWCFLHDGPVYADELGWVPNTSIYGCRSCRRVHLPDSADLNRANRV